RDFHVTGVQTCALPISVHTTFFVSKKTVRMKGTIHPKSGYPMSGIQGYEIHTGITKKVRDDHRCCPFFLYENVRETDGWIQHDHSVIGTDIHHLVYTEEWRTLWYNLV